MREDCFSYREENIKTPRGFSYTRTYCDCTERDDCDGCTIFKSKDSVIMHIVRKQIQYEDVAK